MFYGRNGHTKTRHTPFRNYASQNTTEETSTDKPMHSPYKSNGGLARLLNALRYSMKGLGSAFRNEAAFRQEVMLSLILLPLALWISQSLVEAAILIGSLLFVLLVELVNSAIEAVADAVTLDEHPVIARAKDLGSAAVLLAIALAVLAWSAVIFG